MDIQIMKIEDSIEPEIIEAIQKMNSDFNNKIIGSLTYEEALSFHKFLCVYCILLVYEDPHKSNPDVVTRLACTYLGANAKNIEIARNKIKKESGYIQPK